jgi:competence protein CoiA
MELALVNGARRRPSPGWRGCCPQCGEPVLAKCGEHKAWHWAHKSADCDPWSEGESAWHQGWKNYFPEEWREVTMGDHRADLLTPLGVIELQNSPISSETIREREAFYGRMVWIVNAERFDLALHHEWRLRKLAAQLYKDEPARDLFWLLSDEAQKQEALYREKSSRVKAGHEADTHQELRWRWPSKSWLAARKTIYLDRGDGELLQIRKVYAEGRYLTVTRVDAIEFIDAIRDAKPPKTAT